MGSTPSPQLRSFTGPFGEITLRLHRGAQAGTGALVFFHGAGLMGAAFEDSSVMCDALARVGDCCVLALDSALAAVPKFPQVINEAYFMACHLHEYADDLGVDHRRIAIGGQGFGGALATNVARLAKERRNPALVFQMLLDPLLDLRTPEATQLAFVESYAPSDAERNDPRVSPVVAKNLIGLPATQLVTSFAGAQRAAADAYADALRKAYIEVELVHCDGEAPALEVCGRGLRAALVAHPGA